MTDRKWKRRTPPPDMRSLLSEAQGVGEIKSEDGSSLIDGNLLNNKQRPPRDSKGRFIQRGRRNGSTTRNSKGDFDSQDYSSDELSQESENENHLSNQNGKNSGDENGKKPLSARRTKIPNSSSPKEPLEPYENSSDEFLTTSPNNHAHIFSNDLTPIMKNRTPLPSEGNSQTEIVQNKKLEIPAVKIEQDNQHYRNNENGEKKIKSNEVEVQDDELLLLTAFLELAKESKVVPTQPTQPIQPKRPPLSEDNTKLREVITKKVDELKNGAQKNGSELPILKSPIKHAKKQESLSERPRRQRKQKEFSDYDSDFDDTNTDLYSTSSKRKETRRPKRARNTPSNQMDDDEFDKFIEENGNGNGHDYTNGKSKPKRKRVNTVKDDDEYTDSVLESPANGNLSSEAARPKRQRKSLPISAVDNDDTLQVEEAPVPAPRSKVWKSENGNSHNSNSNGDHSHVERKITKSNSNNSEESEEPEKKRTNVFGRVNRPRLGEIPELEHKKVFCHNKTGIIIGANIRCDCCKKMFSAGEFERHAGLLVARNPYKTIIVTESSKMLDAYRYCTCCHTTESDFWGEGPYGPRTLCASCAEKWKKGLITDIYLKQIVETSKGVECRSKSEKIAPKMTGSTSHASSVSPVPKFHIDKFDYEQFNEYVIKKRTPVVITGLLDKFKDKSMFSFDYLRHRYYDSEISVRYQQCEKVDDSQFEVLKDANKTLGWFIDHAENPDLANDPDFDSGTTDPNKKIVMYAKDFSFGEIVPEWQSEILANIPEFLLPYGKHDLMGYLDEATRPIVWMAYVGADDTRTPLHLDKLATIAFNLLVCGKGTKRWWLVDTSERERLESLVSKEGGSLFKDNYWMAPHELEEAGLKMWYHEQTLGDLVIVPPMIPHTVINANGLSCAVAANLLNESVVEICWKMEQFYRTINRTSIYRIKPTVNAVVRSELAKGDAGRLSESVVKIFSEMVDQETVEGNPNAELEEGFFLCDGCSAEIFNRRYHCSQCRAGDYDLCVQCYEKFGREHFHQMILKERIPLEQLKNTLQEAQAHLFKQQKPSSPTNRVAIHNLLN